MTFNSTRVIACRYEGYAVSLWCTGRSRHCRVYCEGGRYSIGNFSTHPVFDSLADLVRHYGNASLLREADSAILATPLARTASGMYCHTQLMTDLMITDAG